MNENCIFKELINTNSVEESNIFLELLWDKLEITGWHFQPFVIPGTKIIHIGENKIGSFSYTYKEKGKIENLIIKYSNSTNITSDFLHEVITECKNALQQPMTKYWMKIKLSNETNFLIKKSSYKNIAIVQENNSNYVIIGIQSKTHKDASHKLFNFLIYFCNILLEYTNVIFSFSTNFEFLNLLDDFELEIDSSYDYDWIEVDEMIKNNTFILPKEFFLLTNILLISPPPFFEQKNYGLLLNSSQILFSVANLNHLCLNSSIFSRTVSDELLNALVISSLEPLALIKNSDSTRCSMCNNIKYSVTSKVKELIKSYFAENTYLLNLISEKYTERSKLFHEGKTKVYDYYFKESFPQLNTVDKNIMIPHHSSCEPLLFDISSFIFRNITKDLLESTDFKLLTEK